MKYLIYSVSQNGTIPCTAFDKPYATEATAWAALDRMLKKQAAGKLSWSQSINLGKAWIVMPTAIAAEGVNIHGKIYK